MYLKSLQIHGFKSFADNTVLKFHRGVTGIVGPNGCGKSNVVDAIRWVLGETSAKALRGGEMADVIFNGTDRRKPLGMAEVTLTLGDCEKSLKVDYNEVSITRRVFRDGKSEYRINNTLCRLRDIHELFMDTGIGRSAYSIMEQGKIDMLLSSKPEDRRAVFEEAAGITKFKKEKREALRKLEFTEANLLRVSDVLAEQERRMNSLKRQVAKARRYQGLATDVKVLDTHFSHKKFKEMNAEREELRNSLRGLDAKLIELERELPDKESSVRAARERSQELEAQLSVLRNELNEHRSTVQSAESRLAFNAERRNELEGRIGQNRLDIDQTLGKVSQQEFDFESMRSELTSLSEKIHEQEQKLTQQDKIVSEKRADRDAKEASLRETRAESNKAQSLIASTQARIESSLAQVEGNRDRARQLEEELNRHTLQLEEARLERENIVADLESRDAKLSTLEEEFASSERNFQKLRGDLDSQREIAKQSHRELAEKSSRLTVLQQLLSSGEGYQRGTQSVLSGLDDPDLYKNGTRGVLSNFIQVGDEFAPAVEAALGSHLQTVLVRDSSLAESIIEKLTLKNLGEACILSEDFVPVNKESQVQALPDGAKAWALDKVQVDKSVVTVVQTLLDNVLIVDSLKTAIKLRSSYSDLIFVTLEGEMLGVEGIIRGGRSSGEETSVLQRQNEVRSLEEEVSLLAKAEEEAQQKVLEIEKEISEVQEAVEVSRDRLQQHKVERSTLEGQMSLAAREVESLEGKIEHVQWEQSQLEERDQSTLVNREEMEEELQSARVRLDNLEGEEATISSELEEARLRQVEAADVLNELRTAVAVERRSLESASAQQGPMETRLNELRELAVRRESEIASFSERIESSVEEDEQLRQNAESSQVRVTELEAELEESASSRAHLLEEIEAAESVLGELRKEVSKMTDQRGREEVAATKVDLRLENLLTGIQERHQIDITVFRPDPHALATCIENQKKAHSRMLKRQGNSEEAESNKSNEEALAAEPTPEEIEAVSEALKEVDEDDQQEILLPKDYAEPDWGFVESSLSELKRKLDSMGPVNVDAIEEFEELEERHNFVRNQHDDLVNSKDELLNVIEKINVETERLFGETFAKVRKNFREMFKELFGEKGKADLILMDEDDPLESGIEVIAKPPGKKLQSISLLSGGERSMTAVALLFSIYMVKPSPFCVLDELDAPLDESNIGRFLRVLDRFIDQSQFIIVTHSKRTMGRADVMYGVTMEEFGVSKPVGMRLTSEDEVNKNSDDAKSAAQKAALKLDA